MHTSLRSRRMTKAAAAISIVALAACGGSTASSLTSNGDGGGDSSSSNDTGSKSDGHATHDGGVHEDSGHSDTGQSTDAGTSGDTGQAKDTGLSGDSGTDNDTGASHDSGTHVDAGKATCPTNAPTVGSACPKIGFVCQYGSSPILGCDEVFDCAASGWTEEPNGADAGRCDKTDAAAGCPASPPSGACTVLNEQCGYAGNPGTTCDCSFGDPPGAGLHWDCTQLPEGCPAARPAIGSACQEPGLECDYDHCAGGIELKCEDATWQPYQGGACPG